ncbi:hypothetical protein FKM82_013514 [Ascaphus truei]|uniref:C-type lectin domain family 4 member E-like isoform X2 n=1 Tax=Ascaphus truei TaxID=8439 RepID=UPI003F5A6ECD
MAERDYQNASQRDFHYHHSNKEINTSRKITMWRAIAIISLILVVVVIATPIILHFTKLLVIWPENLFNEAQSLEQLMESSCTYTSRSDIQNKDSILHCPHGWELFRGKCYYFSLDQMNWEMSKIDCERRESYLSIVNDSKVQEYFEGKSRVYWIGLSKTDASVWIWNDGSILNEKISHWNYGQPDDHLGIEMCVASRSEWAPNTWNDDACDKTFFRICERDAGLSYNLLCGMQNM